MLLSALAVATLGLLAVPSNARALPPWPYAAGAKGGMPGIAWFGANVSGFENASQLAMLGDYSMAIFGWQAFLDGDGYTGELDQLVEQCQRVKAKNPKTATVVYIDGLRVEPFYGSLRKIMRDPHYEDFFLRNASYANATHRNPGFIPATTYCAQMMSKHAPPFSKHKPSSPNDPKVRTMLLLLLLLVLPVLTTLLHQCLSWYWNWFNSSAVDFYLNELLLPQAIKPGFDGVFFDGSDGFMRGTWKRAENVDKSMTDDDALKAMVDVHVRGAQMLFKHKKYVHAPAAAPVAVHAAADPARIADMPCTLSTCRTPRPRSRPTSQSG